VNIRKINAEKKNLLKVLPQVPQPDKNGNAAHTNLSLISCI
jgi:hypothetical protein